MSRSYGGQTAEQRMNDRRATLIDTALTLLGEGGVEAVTMRAVTVRAGLNDRYFYENFTDRNALLVAVIDDIAAEGTLRILDASAAAAGDVTEVITTAWQAGLTFLTEDPRRARILIESQATELLRARRHQIVRVLAAAMVQEGGRILGQDLTSEPDSELASLTLVSGIIELLTMWLRGDIDITQDRLAHFLTDLILTNVELGARSPRQTRTT